MACEKIFYNVGWSTLYSASFIVDERMGEVHVFHDGHFEYTDGIQPRVIHWYEEYNDSIYTIGIYPPYGSSSDLYTYMLHKCDLSYKSCQQLPFHYTDSGGSYSLTFDESKNELKVYKSNHPDDVLIFSYGIEPKCYVEGCTVPDE
jgi:hypothetical protein